MNGADQMRHLWRGHTLNHSVQVRPGAGAVHCAHVIWALVSVSTVLAFGRGQHGNRRREVAKADAAGRKVCPTVEATGSQLVSRDQVQAHWILVPFWE